MLSKTESDAAYIYELETQNKRLRETPQFTPAEEAAIHADLAACEREAAINEAARKVADAAAHYYDVDDGNVEWDGNAFCAFDDAVREYRDLTKSPSVKKGSDD